MHVVQRKIMNLAQEVDISGMGLRRLGALIDEKWPQKVKYHLNKLEDSGHVELNTKKNRVEKVLKKTVSVGNPTLLRIPVWGEASAGPAEIFAEQKPLGALQVSPSVLSKSDSKGLFAIRVVGNSLDQATELEGGPVDSGDYVIIDSSIKIPKDGDYVLSIIDNMANLKRFYKDDATREIRLVSESSLNIPPITIHESDLEASGYSVNGKIIKVIKS